ncbi:MAG: metalloregulator ArsR/SmtB family transcription factor [Pseudobdellovibrionaceae bacterium]|nr:metalloregulator ArsR/SmtB family transcription factor [Pseudobdellovibrionaceae bacterium]
MRNLAAITKALADENRLKLIMALMDGELAFAKLTQLIPLAASTASKHMSILYSAGLVDSRKHGRILYYRLARESADPRVRKALTWVQDALMQEPSFQASSQHFTSIDTEESPCE